MDSASAEWQNTANGVHYLGNAKKTVVHRIRMDSVSFFAKTCNASLDVAVGSLADFRLTE